MDDTALVTLGMTSFAIYVATLFVLCFSGTLLTERLGQIGDAVYEATWYELPLKYQIHVRIIMMRSQREFELTAAKLITCKLETFVKVSRFSYRYFRFEDT